jgi:hypothetical protein
MIAWASADEIAVSCALASLAIAVWLLWAAR